MAYLRRFLLLLLLAAFAAPGPEALAQPPKKKTPAKAPARSGVKKKTPVKKKPKPRPAGQRPKPRPATQPTVEPGPTPWVPPGSILVSKSGFSYDELAPVPEPEKSRGWFFRRGPRYKYLTPSVRAAIDKARVPLHRWRYVVVHNSGTRQGNAKAFDHYHRRVRKMPNGLAYHFVIGNGTTSGNGQIEIGSRWHNQVSGGHVHSDYFNSIALGVCLVGDFNREKPSRQQLEALDELVRYLRKRVGETEAKTAAVKPHKVVNPPRRPTDCPGNAFPYYWLREKFD